uniref:MHC class II beta chain N-terminal domain-containing protein n=1 Tax=Sphenodon punctatus TaxID=8508 RepID=A0A8D0L983_SPHPU
MGAAGIPGAGSRWAGALLVTLTLLRPHLAHCTEPPEHFLLQWKSQCVYTDGLQRVRYLFRNFWERQEFMRFDSELGRFVAVTELGRPIAEYLNSQEEVLRDKQAKADTFCRDNYRVFERSAV